MLLLMGLLGYTDRDNASGVSAMKTPAPRFTP